MEEINKDFDVPYYIFEEIIEYIELTAQGHCKTMKWENIKSLLRLAQMNKRLTKEQVDFIIKEFSRE